MLSRPRLGDRLEERKKEGRRVGGKAGGLGGKAGGLGEKRPEGWKLTPAASATATETAGGLGNSLCHRMVSNVPSPRPNSPPGF